MKKVEDIVTIKVSSEPGSLKTIRQVVQKAAQLAGCDEKLVQNLVLAVTEASMNIIQHAYQGNPNGAILLQIQKVDSQLEFCLIDYGLPSCADEIKPRQLDELRPGGLGCHFIKHVMDEVQYLNLNKGAGNKLLMIKRIN